jgi:protoheme IX farnesyltransferase
MIGWACVTGGVSLDSILLFLIIFLWTPAHFWALALFKMRDYGAVGVPMMPNVAGEGSTKNQMMVYAVLTALVGVGPSFTGLASPAYGVFAAVLGAIFVLCSISVRRMPEGDAKMVPAKKMFAYSVFYLFAMFSGLLADHVAASVAAFVGGAL